MDYEDSLGSGGSTPVQDENEYEGSPPPSPGNPPTPQGSHLDGEEPMEVDSAVGGGRRIVIMRGDDEDNDYISDGGEVEREDVERAEDDNDDYEEGEQLEREQVEREVEEYSPARPPHSPLGSSPAWSGPRSPPGSASPPASPTGSGSGIASPAVSGGSSPAQEPASPPSPAQSGSPRSRSASPAGSHPRSRSPSPAGSARSRSGSPAGSARSRSGSPAGSARSRSGSPAGSARSRSGSPAGSARSRSASPAGSARSRSGSPAGSARSRSGSPAGSARSRSGSPAGSARSRSGSPAGSARSRSGSPAGSARSRSGSPAGSVHSRSGSASSGRSRSKSPAGAGPQSPAGSKHSSRHGSRSPSGSPASSRHSSGSPVSHRRRRVIESDKENDTDDEEERSKVTADKDEDAEEEEVKKGKDSDDEDRSDKESDVDINLIADIFGSSDEEEEFEGFREADLAPSKKKEKTKTTIKSDDEGDDEANDAALPREEEEKGALPELSEDENEEEARKSARGEDFVSDFDLMMQKKKEEQGQRRRKRKDFDMINDNDDLIADMIRQMKEAAEEDRTLNEQRQAATKKLKLLPFVAAQLKKSDLNGIFLESGILSAITEWLAPLPDKSLPHLSVRGSMLRSLSQFTSIGSDSLKNSGIGKAVMYLYKHPKEIKENRDRAGKLINEWSRPIFNLTSNYKNLSREEREQRDYEQLPKKRRISLEGGQTPRRDIDKALAGEEKTLRPGDPGWVYRARVPNPSYKDYVVRPKSNVEIHGKVSSKKQLTRYDKRARALAERKRNAKNQRAVTISIEGRNMAL